MFILMVGIPWQSVILCGKGFQVILKKTTSVKTRSVQRHGMLFKDQNVFVRLNKALLLSLFFSFYKMFLSQ